MLGGEFSGLPVSIRLDDGERLEILEMPSSANGWSRLRVRNDGARRTELVIRWTAQ
jgi:hypothetical protein